MWLDCAVGNMCFCASKVSMGASSLRLAMASSLKIFNHKNPNTSLFAFSSSSLSPTPVADFLSWKRKLYPCPSRVENSPVNIFSSQDFLATVRRYDGLQAVVSCSRTHLTKRHWNSHRLECCRRFGGLKHGLVKVRGINSIRASVVFTSTEGPVDLSFESSSSGPVNGDGEDDDDGTRCLRGEIVASPARAANVQGANAVSSSSSSASQMAMMAELEAALGFPLGQGPQSPSPKPLVIVISGPSGVGKDAVIKRLQQIRGDLHLVVTATTRPMRPGEVDGVDYFFMSKTEFQEMIDNHELLEHAIVYGDYKGIPKQQVRECMKLGVDVVLRVDVQGAATVRAILGQEAVFIFLVAESEVALVRRLIERKTETMDKMLVRVGTAREELTRMEEFDYVVVNSEGMLDRTVGLICSIIDAEKARVHPRAAQL